MNNKLKFFMIGFFDTLAVFGLTVLGLVILDKVLTFLFGEI